MTFDGLNKRIILSSTSTSASEIWTEWVKWLDSDFTNNKWPAALKQVGGDDLGSGLLIPPYIFLQNGWRIRPMEANHLLVITGNIFVDGGGQPVVNTLGAYNVSIQYTVPVQAQGYSTTAGTGDSITADEIWTHPSRTLTAATSSSLTEEQNAKLMSLDTSNIQVDPADIWAHPTRSLTVASGMTSEQNAMLLDIADKVQNLDGLNVNVDPAAIWTYSNRTLTSSTGGTAELSPEFEAKVDAIKAKTDKFIFDISNRLLTYLDDKSGYSLTTLERDSIAGAVQSSIINETDGALVLQAITDKIASVNPSLGDLTLSAIASSVWSNASRSLTQYVSLSPEQEAKLNSIASDVWNSSVRELTSNITLTPEQEAKIDNIPSKVWAYGSRGLTGNVLADIRKVNNVPVMLSDFQADLSDIPASIWSYPTRAVTNMNSITPSDVWSYSSRELSGIIDANILQIKGANISGISDLKTDISGLPTAIWEYENRDLTVETGLNSTQNTLLQNIPSAVWSYTNRNITNPSTLTSGDIWSYNTRSLTDKSADIKTLNGNPVSSSDFKTDLSTIPSSIWNYSNRTLTQEFTIPAGFEAKIDSIKAKTDKLFFDVSNRLLSYLDNKTGFELTVDEKYVIANIVEQEILNEGDSEKVIQAIVDKIAQANPTLDELTLGGIAAAVWSNNTRTLSTPSGLTVSQETKLDNVSAKLVQIEDSISDIDTLTADEIWNYTNRNLTGIVPANIVQMNASPVTLQDFKTDLSSIPTSVWNYVTRSTTDTKLSASDIWTFNNRELTSEIGLSPSQEAKIDSIKVKTDKLSFKSGTDELVTYVFDKSGFELNSNSINQISDVIQSGIINSTDGYDVLGQISSRISNDNPGLSNISITNIVEAVWSYVNRTITETVELTPEQVLKIDEINARIKGTIKANITEVNAVPVGIADFRNDISGVSTLTAEDVWEYTNRTLTSSLLTQNEHDKLMSIDTLLLKKILLNTKEIKNNQMIIYDDDGMTVLFKWNLKNKNNEPSELAVYKTEKI